MGFLLIQLGDEESSTTCHILPLAWKKKWCWWQQKNPSSTRPLTRITRSHQEYGSKPPKSALQITSSLYCWLWDCDKNKAENPFQTGKWICIIRLLEIGSLAWTCASDEKVPAFREWGKVAELHKIFQDRRKIKTPIIFCLYFFPPRNFDTFQLNKNWDYIRSSYKMVDHWDCETKQKDQVLCATFKSSFFCAPKKHWAVDNNCGMDLRVLWSVPAYKTPPQLWIFAASSWREVHRNAAHCSWTVFLHLEEKHLIYTREIQDSFCQSKLREMATMLYNCTKKKGK